MSFERRGSQLVDKSFLKPKLGGISKLSNISQNFFSGFRSNQSTLSKVTSSKSTASNSVSLVQFEMLNTTLKKLNTAASLKELFETAMR